jgi:predicted O-methyltransferase YrrM
MTCAAHDLAKEHGQLLPEDVDLIQEMVRSLPDHHVHVVDLGSGFGTTAVSVFTARPEHVTVWSIDLLLDRLQKATAILHRINNRLGDWCARSGDSLEGASLWPAWSQGTVIDMLMLDTGHEYEETKQELEAWLPYMRRGGLLWLHDYTPAYPGCVKAIDEAVEEGFIAHMETRGWSWSGVKA